MSPYWLKFMSTIYLFLGINNNDNVSIRFDNTFIIVQLKWACVCFTTIQCDIELP